jgi:DNA-directed RNA polymerase subunit K/omega
LFFISPYLTNLGGQKDRQMLSWEEIERIAQMDADLVMGEVRQIRKEADKPVYKSDKSDNGKKRKRTSESSEEYEVIQPKIARLDAPIASNDKPDKPFPAPLPPFTPVTAMYDPNDPDPDSYLTSPYLNKFQRAAVLGARATQIESGAPIMVELEDEADPLLIAQRELKEGKLDLYISCLTAGDRTVNR